MRYRKPAVQSRVIGFTRLGARGQAAVRTTLAVALTVAAAAGATLALRPVASTGGHLRIEPAAQILPASEGETFRALLGLEDGGELDVTDRAHWSVVDGGARVAGRLEGWAPGQFMTYEPGSVEVVAEVDGLQARAGVEVARGEPELTFEVDGKRPVGESTRVQDVEIGLTGVHPLRVLAEFPDGQVADFTRHAIVGFGAYHAEDQPFAVSGLGTRTPTITAKVGGQGHLQAQWRRRGAMLFVHVHDAGDKPLPTAPPQDRGGPL